MDKLYPIVVIQDRYHGLYSGGEWFAIARADTPFYDVGDLDPTRASYCLESGPNGDDEEAVAFWAAKPDWVAAGSTPQAALNALAVKCAA